MIFLVSKNNEWSVNLYNNLKNDYDCRFYNDDTYISELNSLNPDWVFFFHWSKIVPSEIYENYQCVVIHTGNLPKNRGGSPLQNQIIEGITNTNVNAIQMIKDLDGGDIYCSLPLTLQGSLSDIWISISTIAYQLISTCVSGNYKLKQQVGIPQIYKRKKDNKINFSSDNDLRKIYDQVRCLDAESYPSSYCIVGNYKLEFSRAKLDNGVLIADVRITST